MCLFLSRFEMFLPIPSFQQIASKFDMSCVLEECLEPMSQSKDLRTLLQYQKGKLGHKDGSLHSDCIISALKLPSGKKMTVTTQSSVGFSRGATLCASEIQLLQTANTEQLQVDRIKEDPEREITVDKIVCIQGEDGTQIFLGEVTDQLDEAFHPLKECQVQLNRLPSLAPSQPVCHKSSSKTQVMIVEQKRDLQTSGVTDDSSVPPEVSENSEYNELAPIDSCSDDDLWSYHVDGGENDLSSNHSDDDCVSPGRSSEKASCLK
ncbi:uncharacterized protein LOC117531351 [Thalassophryne amazonica]|uniref:uncharacterized protein LOC117531351 n=1 Tax=Thalassophryne amazonica TaxID=390379 RepID=UPI0014715C13|nr:uncharacterized protein LOC117531351 [Thalassophryne amazonica]